MAHLFFSGKPITKGIVLLALLAFFGIAIHSCVRSGISNQYQQLKSRPALFQDSGKAEFLYGDMGAISFKTLRTNGFVYKVVTLSLILKEHPNISPEELGNWPQKPLFQKYGFLYPTAVENWPELGNDLQWEKPAGIISGYVNVFHPLRGKMKIEVSNFGCATCHSGPTYQQDGSRTDEIAMGLPNTSVSLAAFTKDLYAGYKVIKRMEAEQVEARLTALFPNTGKKELKGLTFYVKLLQKEVAKLEESMDSPVPYDLGGAGYTNGIGSIKNVLSLFDHYTYHNLEAALVSTPGLADRPLRSSLLVSGNYAPEGKPFFEEKSLESVNRQHLRGLADIVSIFTIGTMGFDAKLAYDARPHILKAVTFMSTYHGTPFPGKVDFEKAERGRKIYRMRCENCHGRYEGRLEGLQLTSFPNQFVRFEKTKTDSMRAVRITAENLKVLDRIKLGKVVDGRPNRGYVAPILTDLWASAPYLHNGSVPTIWHLMNPGQRPEKFYLGGHALDFEKLGIKGEMKDGIYAYPKNYQPWSAYEIYDTHTLGRGNGGHGEPFKGLDENEKFELIEFLKLL